MDTQTIRIGTFGFAYHERSVAIFRGVMKCAEAYSGLICHDFSTENEEDMKLEVPDQASRRPPWTGLVDGMLVVFGYKTDPELAIQWLLSGGVPVVNIASDIIDPRVPAVIPEDHEIVDAAARHLVSCGCQRFLHIGLEHLPVQTRRGDLFTEALRHTGLPIDRFDLPKDFELRPRAEALSSQGVDLIDLLRRPPHPVGVWVSATDDLAREVAKLCASLQLNIPRQVAILGIDNSLTSFGNRPTLSTLDLDLESRAYRATQCVVQMANGAPRPSEPLYQPIKGLIARESTGFGAEASEILPRALELMRAEACRGLTVNDLAEFLEVDRSTLKRQFRKHLNRTPAEEIKRLRLTHARGLLARTNFTVTRIASEVGFSGVAAFSNFFQAEMGVNPSAYRKSIQAPSKD